MPKTHRPVEIAILLYPQVQLAAVHGLTDLFRFADVLTSKRLGKEAPLLRLSHFSLDGRDGLERTFDTVPGVDTEPAIVIIPPCHVAPETNSQTALLAAWLRGLSAAGATLASVCGGTFLLAETGLLDGRLATTHWIFANELAVRFPRIRVDTNPLVIDDGHILTAGGMMAWADLGLTLVNRVLGPAAMIDTARFMMIDPPGREQRFYSAFAPVLTHGDVAVLKVQELLGASTTPTTVAAMATYAGLQERTFVRRFRKVTGFRPTDYQQHLRIDRARVLLESTVQLIDKVAWTVGYSDPASFRRVFARITGLSPGSYRKRFARVRPAPGPEPRATPPLAGKMIHDPAGMDF